MKKKSKFIIKNKDSGLKSSYKNLHKITKNFKTKLLSKEFVTLKDLQKSHL